MCVVVFLTWCIVVRLLRRCFVLLVCLFVLYVFDCVLVCLLARVFVRVLVV